MYVTIALIASIGSVGALAYYTINKQKQEIILLAQNNTQLEGVVETQTNTIARIQQDQQRYIELNNNLQTQLQSAQSNVDRLRNILIEHDLTNLALQRPGLIERRINEGTKSIFDQLESDTAR
jgi:TolA-binding protein